MARMKKVSSMQILEALRRTGGNQTLAAKELEKQLGISISRSTISKRIAKEKKLAAAVAEIEAETVDMAESQLMKGIQSGNMTAIIFYLKTKGKQRGYSERIETDTSLTVSKPVPVHIYLPDNGRDTIDETDHKGRTI